MKMIPLLTLLFVMACTTVKVELEPPVFEEEGIRNLGWKKVLLPINERKTGFNEEETEHQRLSGRRMMRTVGWIKVMEYRVSATQAVRYFDVLDRRFNPVGRISDHGKVTRHVIDSYSRKAVTLHMGKHTMDAGVAQLLNLKGNEKHLIVVLDMKPQDTYIYQQKLKRDKMLADKLIQAEKKDDDE